MSLTSFFDGLGTIFKPVTKFMTDNPVVGAMLINGIAAAFEPSEDEKYRDKLQTEKEFADIERKRRNKNLEVGGLSLPEPASRATNYLNAPRKRGILQPSQLPEDPLAQMGIQNSPFRY